MLHKKGKLLNIYHKSLIALPLTLSLSLEKGWFRSWFFSLRQSIVTVWKWRTTSPPCAERGSVGQGAAGTESLHLPCSSLAAQGDTKAGDSERHRNVSASRMRCTRVTALSKAKPAHLVNPFQGGWSDSLSQDQMNVVDAPLKHVD